jgi:large subunit ribosomal protein L1
MDKQIVLKALKELRASSGSKKFSQSIDMQIRLKEIDIKKQDQKIDMYTVLPHSLGKRKKIIAFVDAQLAPQAKQNCDTVILKEDFPKYAPDKKAQKKLASAHDYTISQLELMASFAATFGKVFGPKGKMPNPKAGCVVPGTAQLGSVVQKLQNTVRLITKNDEVIRTVVGTDKMSDEELSDNILAIYNTLLSKLPQEKNNIKDVMIKFTMGPAYVLGHGFKVPITTEEPKTKTAKKAKPAVKEAQ